MPLTLEDVMSKGTTKDLVNVCREYLKRLPVSDTDDLNKVLNIQVKEICKELPDQVGYLHTTLVNNLQLLIKFYLTLRHSMTAQIAADVTPAATRKGDSEYIMTTMINKLNELQRTLQGNVEADMIHFRSEFLRDVKTTLQSSLTSIRSELDNLTTQVRNSSDNVLRVADIQKSVSSLSTCISNLSTTLDPTIPPVQVQTPDSTTVSEVQKLLQTFRGELRGYSTALTNLDRPDRSITNNQSQIVNVDQITRTAINQLSFTRLSNEYLLALNNITTESTNKLGTWGVVSSIAINIGTVAALGYLYAKNGSSMSIKDIPNPLPTPINLLYNPRAKELEKRYVAKTGNSTSSKLPFNPILLGQVLLSTGFVPISIYRNIRRFLAMKSLANLATSLKEKQAELDRLNPDNNI